MIKSPNAKRSKRADDTGATEQTQSHSPVKILVAKVTEEINRMNKEGESSSSDNQLRIDESDATDKGKERVKSLSNDGKQKTRGRPKSTKRTKDKLDPVQKDKSNTVTTPNLDKEDPKLVKIADKITDQTKMSDLILESELSIEAEKGFDSEVSELSDEDRQVHRRRGRAEKASTEKETGSSNKKHRRRNRFQSNSRKEKRVRKRLRYETDKSSESESDEEYLRRVLKHVKKQLKKGKKSKRRSKSRSRSRSRSKRKTSQRDRSSDDNSDSGSGYDSDRVDDGRSSKRRSKDRRGKEENGNKGINVIKSPSDLTEYRPAVNKRSSVVPGQPESDKFILDFINLIMHRVLEFFPSHRIPLASLLVS